MIEVGKPRGSRSAGFTLLEMMIALAVLAGALMWLIEGTTRAIAAENHAKMVTTATFLARREMVELEDSLQEKGMTDDAFASESSGDFDEVGFKRFKWKRIVDKIVLPGTGAVQDMLSKSQSSTPSSDQSGAPSMLSFLGSGSPTGAANGGGSNSTAMFTQQFGLVKDILEQGIRKARVSVVWTENGLDKSIEVTEYLTDPRKVDQAIQMPSSLPGGAGGAAGATGSATGSSTGSTTGK